MFLIFPFAFQCLFAFAFLFALVFATGSCLFTSAVAFVFTFATALALLPDSVFLKRVVPSQLPARAATKWIRDTQSYRTEGSFLSHILCGCSQMNMKISRLVNANLMPGQQLASIPTSWRRYASKASCSPSPTRSCRRDSKI